ncbi:MAG: hypothetical protein KatS3mg038_2095 [Candidatus Kapaibacterium sp.]|nr:MAG: hypothetical protein KatS3mg038_2095 [Candidatus Kapabacteria bacterium]
MKIAVIRPASAGWIFAAGSESSWSITLNRHNYQWWRKLVVQARENYGDGLAAAINATASLYDDAAWQQLVPGAELRHGIGRTLWDGRDLVRISGGGHDRPHTLAAGRSGSARQRHHLLVRAAPDVAGHLCPPRRGALQGTLRAAVARARAAARHIARDYRAGGSPCETHRTTHPDQRPAPPPREAAAEESPTKAGQGSGRQNLVTPLALA